MLQDRILAARNVMTEQNLDFLLVSCLENIRYLVGFTGSDGVVVLGRNACWFLTDSRYTTQANRETSGCLVVEYRAKVDGVAALIREQGGRRVGFEAAHLTVASRDEFAAALDAIPFVPVSGAFDEIRTIKQDTEIDCLERTAALASSALLSIIPLVRPGVSERFLALELEFAMKRGGADDTSFDFIVASGERGALPHGKASDKLIASGELITFDFGALLNGYHSDETVTLALGSTDAQQRRIYGIVKDAHDRAIEAVRPGVPLKELDDLARGYIGEQGYGSYFGHGLGHGVGLEVHERPVVSFRSSALAEEGMVFTIEPGIYIPGWGGVRIEDTVVVTGDGCRLLTTVPKDLMVV